MFKILMMCGTAGLLLAPLTALADSPTLYGLSQRDNSDELLTYDTGQNPFSTSSGYQPSTIAPVNADGLESSLSSMAISGNTLYALSQRGTINEFLTYDLTQNPFSTSSGYQPSTIAPINADGLEGSFISTAISGNTLYALSQRGTIDEFLTYDLTQNPFSTSSGYQPSTIAPINADGLESSIVATAISGNTLYALSERGSIDEFLTYDLTQNPFSTSSGYQPSTIAPINADGLEDSISSIGITGNTLYALSQRGTIDEFLTYDLTQDPFATSSGYQASTIAPINADGLEDSIVSIALTATATAAAALPEPSTWAMMILGVGVIGFALRRQQKLAIDFRFA